MSACGTHSAYVAGCRCDDCKQANREYQRKYRKRSHEARIKAIRHSKKRNHAAMLALRYLREHDSRAYYQVIDQANAWMEREHPN